MSEPRTAAATREAARRAAHRAAENPAAVARAVRIVAAAIERLAQTAPPLTTEQADRLAGLLRPVMTETPKARGRGRGRAA